jgi:hypothetical protein
LYRIRIAETGNSLAACSHSFRTAGEPEAAREESMAEGIARAYELTTADRPAFGDALALLLRLPPEAAGSELVLRLKLVLFGQLGLAEEYETTGRELAALTDGREP